MTANAEVFQQHRPRLFGIAQRMLGSRCEAEDLLQDAYLRWHESRPAQVESSVAFLVTVTTRLCLDRLRKRKQERAHDLADARLAQALVADCAPSPEAQWERNEETSEALAAVLHQLGRDERTAFLLHEVFDYDYPELSRMIGKAEPACRQIVHRARKRVREPGTRFAPTADSCQRMLGRFLAAARTGDRQAVRSLVETDVQYVN